MSGRGKIKQGRSGAAASISVLFAVIVVVAFIVTVSTLEKGERTMGSGVAYRVAEELGKKLDLLLASGHILRLSLESNPAMGEAQTAAIAEGILAGNPCIVGVSTAPGAVIDRYYPAQAGVAWKGHDLLSNPERKDALLKAVELKAPVITGPFESVDGASALFLRYPVYSGGKVWGFSSLTVDFAKLLSSLDLDGRYPGIVFALADVSQAKSPHFLGGKEKAMTGKVASAALARQGVAWSIYAAPAAGWTSSSPFLYVLFAAGLAAAVFLYFLLARKVPAEAEKKLAADERKATATAQRYLGAIPVPETPLSPHSGLVAEIKPPNETESTRPEEVKARPGRGFEIAAGLFPDLAIVEKKRGKPIAFKGPAVKGDLFMPERLLPGWGEAVETKSEGEPASLMPTTSTLVPPAPAHVFVPPVPAPPPRGEFLFSLEEVKPAGDLAILVVDDSEANRDIIGRMLTLRGYRADFAASGAEALERAAAKSYTIVFMDSYMPGMDGCAASRALRATRLNSGAFIIGMSARIGQQELDKCRAAGMDDVLAKPFTLKQLLAFLERSRP
ncbi:MAG: response regulator [Spirochaetes bacterium]|nr:response regulator [Spirochaetota bacterium]